MGIRWIAATCLATVLSLAVPASSAQKKPDKKKEAEELLARVQAATDLRAPGSPPFRLRARARISAMEGGPYEGSYVLVWESPQRWREEIMFGEYRDVRVRENDTTWMSRTVDYIPIRILEFRSLIGFPDHVRLRTKEKIGKAYTPKKNPGVTCVKLTRPGGNRELCFVSDPERPLGFTAQVTGWKISFEFSEEHVGFKGKVLPRRIAHYDQGVKTAELIVEELGEPAADSAGLFDPPAGAQALPWCGEGFVGPDFARRAHDDLIALLPLVRRGSEISLRVAVYALVSTDGKGSNVKLVSNNQPNVEQYVLNALKKGGFRPATCEGKPIVSETVLVFAAGRVVPNPTGFGIPRLPAGPSP